MQDLTEAVIWSRHLRVILALYNSICLDITWVYHKEFPLEQCISCCLHLLRPEKRQCPLIVENAALVV